MTQVLIIFDTRYGTTFRLAAKIAEGVKDVAGAEVVTRRVVPPTDGAVETRDADDFRAVAHATVGDLLAADAVITGCPVRTGGLSAGLAALWEEAAALAADGLAGKVGAAFATSTAPGRGLDATLLSLLTPMLHQGMVIYAPGRARGGCPYGLAVVHDGSPAEAPTAEIARQAMDFGRAVAGLAERLSGRPVLHEAR
jgi:NAD(P)H dehydrogenase (quinone)